MMERDILDFIKQELAIYGRTRLGLARFPEITDDAARRALADFRRDVPAPRGVHQLHPYLSEHCGRYCEAA